MFIHGGGFTGGTNKPGVEMGNYYASRDGFSIDYRTTEELCDSEDLLLCKDKIMEMTREEKRRSIQDLHLKVDRDGLDGSESIKHLQQAIAMYTAQRDAKAALRWIVANSSTYGINKDFITVGASLGNYYGSLGDFKSRRF